MRKLKISFTDTPIWKKIIYFLLTMISFIVLAYLSLVLVYCIPTDTNMKENMKNSCDKFQGEVYQHNYMERRSSLNDIYSDAIFLCIAAEDLTDTPFVEAIKDKFNSPSAALYPQYDISKLYDPDNFIFEDYPYQEDYEYDYGRYWHGYLIYLKPLLYFFDYGVIRTILMFSITALFAYLLISVYKVKKYLCVPIVIVYIFINPVLVGLSLMYFPMTMLAMLYMLFIVKFKRWLQNNTHLAITFMIFGAFVNFFDMMSFPFICLFIPLAFYLAISNKSLKDNFISMIFAVIFWAVGYFVMMGTKLLLFGMVCGEEQFTASLSKAGDWFNTEDSIIAIIYNAFYEGTQPLVLFATLVIILYTIYLIIINRKIYLKYLIPLILISLAPLAIMFILKHHTEYHLQFSYREFAITIFALISYCSIYYEKYIAS